jgi:hypothetical protein
MRTLNNERLKKLLTNLQIIAMIGGMVYLFITCNSIHSDRLKSENSKNSQVIDPELLEMKSRSSSYEKLDSFLEKKFIKLVRNKENVDLFSMLFSNQSILSHIPSNNNIQTFFRHVQGGISVNDFDEYQKCAIELLIKKRYY